eukprot:11199705-Lingulodinium_polyedra.AAC.1
MKWTGKGVAKQKISRGTADYNESVLVKLGQLLQSSYLWPLPSVSMPTYGACEAANLRRTTLLGRPCPVPSWSDPLWGE